MSEDQFTKLFNYMEQHFGRLEAELAHKADKTDIENLRNTIDSIIHRLDTDAQERAALTSRVNRHEYWIDRAAPQLKIKFDSTS